MLIPARPSKARFALLGLIPVLSLGLALPMALLFEYIALGQPDLAYFSFDLVSGCERQKCDLALSPKSLIEPHTTERYAQLTHLINNASWHWALHLGPAT